MKIIAIVPLKATSERIPNKNMRRMCGVPLCVYTIEKLLKIREFDEVWVDTNDTLVIECIHNYGVRGFKTFIRDDTFATNTTNGNQLLLNEIQNINSDVYFQILCTSPFLKVDTIKDCIHSIKTGQYKSVVCCSKSKFYLWSDNGPTYDKLHIPNSNDLPNTIYESMCLYGITCDEFMKNRCRIGNNPFVKFIDLEESIDINDVTDFEMASKIQTYSHITNTNHLKHLTTVLNTSILLDIIKERKIPHLFLPGFKQNIRSTKLFGHVKPIQIRRLRENEEPSSIYNCLDSYEDIIQNDVIFVNNLIDKHAYFGDLNASIAMCKNAQGTVVNGYTRDIDRVTALNFPVFYKDNTANDVLGVGTLDFFSKPITIDSFVIHVNDIIFSDTDGVLIFPRQDLHIVLNLSLKKVTTEKNVFQRILNRQSLQEVIQIEGAF